MKSTMFIMQDCSTCKMQTVMVPVLVYSGSVLATRPVSADRFGRTHGSPLGRWGKVYAFYCIECHELSMKATKEQVKQLQAEFRSVEKSSAADKYKVFFVLGNGYQRLLFLDDSLFSVEADRLLRRAVQADPKQFAAYNCLSALYITTSTKMKGFQAALEFATKALERAGDAVEKETALSNMSTAYANMKQYKKAVECMESAQHITPTAEKHYALGLCFLEIKDYVRAKREFEAYLAAEDLENKLYDLSEARAAVEICERRLK